MSDSVRPHRWQPTRLLRPWDSPGKNTGVGCHFLLQCMKVKSESEVAQSRLTLCNPLDCSLPGSSVHGIFQARVLEWGAIAFSGLSINHTLEALCLYLQAMLIKSHFTHLEHIFPHCSGRRSLVPRKVVGAEFLFLGHHSCLPSFDLGSGLHPFFT